MHVKRVSFGVLALIGALLAGCDGGGTIRTPSVGYVEHRGRPYELRDLMNPQYRAESSDSFVRDFQPQFTYVQRITDSSMEPMGDVGLR